MRFFNRIVAIIWVWSNSTLGAGWKSYLVLLPYRVTSTGLQIAVGAQLQMGGVKRPMAVD